MTFQSIELDWIWNGGCLCKINRKDRYTTHLIPVYASSSFPLCACRIAMTSLSTSCWLLHVWSQFFSIFQPPSLGSGSSVCLQLKTRQRQDLILFSSTTVWIRHDSTTGVGLQHTMTACWAFCLYLLDWSYCSTLLLNTVCFLRMSGCMAKYLKQIPSRQDAEHWTHVDRSMSLNHCSMFLHIFLAFQ